MSASILNSGRDNDAAYGATTSGLMRPSRVGPRADHVATMPLSMPVSRSDSDAPTDTAFCYISEQ